MRVVFKIATLVYRFLSGHAPGLPAAWSPTLAQDYCFGDSLEQFAARLTKSRVIILPIHAVAEDVFIWTVRLRRIVNFF